MSTLLFSLRGVPDDEIIEITELLTAQNIDYYETTAGNWGISMPAIWLRDDSQREEAERILNEFHQLRVDTQREQYQQLEKEGKNQRFIDLLKANPLKIILSISMIALILYVSVKVVIEFGF